MILRDFRSVTSTISHHVFTGREEVRVAGHVLPAKTFETSTRTLARDK